MKRTRRQKRAKSKAMPAATLVATEPAPTTGMATKKEAARFLRMSLSTITRMVRDGSLKSKKIRRGRRIPWPVLHELAGEQALATA